MKHFVRFLVLAAALMVAGSVSAQNIVTSNAQGQPIETFLKQHMLGDGVYIYNVKFAGTHDTIHIPDIGTFNANGFGNLSMSKGIIMTTGDVSAAMGPNTSDGKSLATNPYYVDTIMNSFLTSLEVRSCATIDFDFITASGSIDLLYVFGSEEYQEYAVHPFTFNDIFAFLVTGTHPVTMEDSTWNIAILENSVDSAHPGGIPVSIRYINQDSNSTYYQSFYPSNNQPGVQYDGITNKLVASTSLLPCEPYHLHISICNVSDQNLDSGVFFEEGCLTSPMGTPGLSRYRPDTIRKACPISIPLSLSNSSFENVEVKVKFDGSGINGTDYICKIGNTPLTSGDVFTLTDDTVYLNFQSKVTSNNPKSVVVSFESGICTAHPEVCTHDTMRFVIYGDNNIKVKEKTISAEKVVTYVSAELDSGNPPINFQWVPGTDILFPFLQSSPANIWESRDYEVIAYDNQRCYFDTGIVHIVITGNNPNPQGIEEADADGISVYPNPVDNMLHVSADQIERLEIFSIMGSKVYDATPHASESEINTSDLVPGTYALRITTPTGVYVRKVIKH